VLKFKKEKHNESTDKSLLDSKLHIVAIQKHSKDEMKSTFVDADIVSKFVAPAFSLVVTENT